MKKYIIVLMTILLVITCVGCGDVNTTNNNYSNDNYSSNESVSNVESVVEDDKPHGIDGLVDTSATPAGKTYTSLSGLAGETTEFYTDYSFQTKYKDTGKTGSSGNWKFIENGIIRKDNLSNVKYGYNDYFIYKDFLVGVSVDSDYGALIGDANNGYSNNHDNTAKRILGKDFTYEYITEYWKYKGSYSVIDERILKIDSYDLDDGDTYIFYLFIDNDNCVHQAYSKAN